MLSRAASSAKLCRDDVEIIVRGKAHGLFVRRGQRRALARQHQRARRVSDSPDIFGPADLQVALCGDQLADCLRQ